MSEIDEWRKKACKYRELAAVTWSAVTRDLLEDLARAAEAVADERVCSNAPHLHTEAVIFQFNQPY